MADIKDNDDEESGAGSGTSTGGSGGKIEFREFIASGATLRDDQLPADEKRRLLMVHEAAHAAAVKTQRETRADREQMKKQGKASLQHQAQGKGMSSQYPPHPMLSNKAQFSGIDRQVNALPTENVAETNKENRDKLDLQYNLMYRPQNAPRFNPRPIQR